MGLRQGSQGQCTSSHAHLLLGRPCWREANALTAGDCLVLLHWGGGFSRI